MENKVFAGDSFFTAGNKLDVSSTAPLTVAFIGAGNNPMVGMTVAVAVAIEETSK